MPVGTILRIRQDAPLDGKYLIRLTLKRSGKPELEAEANIEFALSPQEQEDLRWYLEQFGGGGCRFSGVSRRASALRVIRQSFRAGREAGV